METITFQATDGFELHGRIYGVPAQCRSALLIASAMGVPQRFYADFAEWLAGQGIAVLTFDYRGIGDSRPAGHRASLRGLQADLTIWAERDASAALDVLDKAVSAGTPIHWLGHSLGGQIFGMVPNRARVSRLVTVGSGTGYWLHQTAKVRSYVWWLWFVVCPVAMKLYGYFPGKRLKKIGDVPQGAMAQWREWCLQRDYMIGERGAEARRGAYAALSTPILSLSFTDDEYMSARNIQVLHGFYASAPREMRRIQPADIGERRIGHFGFFRKRFEAKLWPQVSHWLAT